METATLKKKNELWTLLSLALPVVVTQASDTVMLFTDRLFLSRLGIEYVAPAMSGGLSSFMFMSLFLGITGYVNTIVSQYFGANIKAKCARSTVQAVFLSLAAYPVLLVLSPLFKNVFEFVGHGPRQVELEFTYFSILIFGSIFGLIRNSLAGFFIGIGRTSVVMVSNVLGMLINIPLNFILIFGIGPFPALGIAGAAIGSICGSFTTALILFLSYMNAKYRTEFSTHREWKPDKSLFKKLIFFGSPAGIEQFLNVAAFNLFVQLMMSVNTVVAAAVTITFNYDMVAFIPMVGLNMAIMSLVGRHMGARDIDGARKVTFLSAKVAFSYSGFMMLVFIIGAPLLVDLFIAPGMEGNHDQIKALAEIMLRLAAIYTLSDATQLVFGGALRGAGDTHWCMIISVTLHWIMATITIIMVKVLHVDAIGIWIFFIGFVLTMGIALFVRFQLGHWKKIKVISDEEILENMIKMEEGITTKPQVTTELDN
ncbi:MAG: MATE family efflux transporter [Spirochaetales bacterium]|nr:MATE family efflux transporter [Spirochaetales bacterium]